eukprot:1377005-Rhodomonas_salina.1
MVTTDGNTNAGDCGLFAAVESLVFLEGLESTFESETETEPQEEEEEEEQEGEQEQKEAERCGASVST